MGIKVQNGAGRYASFENHYQVDTDEPAGVVQKRILVPSSVVPWSITELAMDHVKITHARSQIDQNVVLRTEQEVPTVDLFVQLSGQSLIRRSQQPNRQYRGWQCNVVYTPGYEGELHLSGPAVSTFAVQFAAPFFGRLLSGSVGCLERFVEAIERGQMRALTPHNAPVTPTMHAILYDVLRCPFTGLTKRLFLEAKLLELLALQIDQMGTGQSDPVTAMLPEDADKLVAVREWLNEHFLQATTLSEVARLVGLNEFKLKKGFRTLFNTTVFGYLTNLRMNHARRLLLDSGQTVAEAADALGYEHVHHFSHAFRKHFGYLPSELRGQPTYNRFRPRT